MSSLVANVKSVCFFLVHLREFAINICEILKVNIHQSLSRKIPIDPAVIKL